MRSLTIITALLFIVMAVYTSPLRPSIPELQLTYSEAAFCKIVSHWNDAQRLLFMRHFWLDFPLLVCYGLLGWLLVVRGRASAALAVRWRCALAWLLPAAACADAMENLLHLYLFAGRGPFAGALYLFTGLLATGKWLLITAFVACLGWLWIKHTLSRGDQRL